MLTLFYNGGPRQGLLSSKGLNTPWNESAPLPEPVITGFRFYPSPVVAEAIIDFGFNDSWVGKQISVVNSNGQVVAILRVNSKQVKYNFSTLRPGVYFLHASNGEQKIAEKFIKL